MKTAINILKILAETQHFFIFSQNHSNEHKMSSLEELTDLLASTKPPKQLLHPKLHAPPGRPSDRSDRQLPRAALQCRGASGDWGGENGGGQERGANPSGPRLSQSDDWQHVRRSRCSISCKSGRQINQINAYFIGFSMHKRPHFVDIYK